MRGCSAGIEPRRPFSRRQLWRAEMKLRQWARVTSTGASAREVRIELAMMMPAVACWLITSQAPMPSTADCRIMRRILERAAMPPEMSATRCEAAIFFRLWSCQSAFSRVDMPMACTTSALRRLASASPMRSPATEAASRAGSRLRNSVAMVMPIRITPPTVAVQPISGWNTKQMPR